MAALTPWRPRRDLAAMERSMDDMFDRLSREFFGPGWGRRSRWAADGWTPAIDSHIENGTLMVKVDLPGIDPKQVSISVLGSQLTIEGERKYDTPEDEQSFYHELPYGKFSRTVTLPEGVDGDSVKADYKDGVLVISMPAPKSLVSKRIPIEIQS